jgi:hypothetical protein
MSQVSPGWYPDPSGRFAQRYHDGTRWTEHVADAQGNRATDVPGGQAGPASYAGSTRAHDQGGQQTTDPYGRQPTGSGRGYGGQSARERGHGQESSGSGRGSGQEPSGSGRRYRQRAPRGQDWGQESPGSSWDQGQQPGQESWGQGAGAGSWPTGGGGPAGGHEPPHTRRPVQAGPGATQYDAGWPYGQPTARQPDYAYAPAAAPRGFTPTVGLIVAAVGAVLLLLSLFGLDFLELSFPGLSQSVSLGDIAGDFGEGAPAALASYADFGRFLAVLVIVLAMLAVSKLVPQLRDISALPVIVAALCGGFALWHVLAMMASGEEGVDVSPTFGAIIGLLGYVGLAAGPFLRQPVGAQR